MLGTLPTVLEVFLHSDQTGKGSSER